MYTLLPIANWQDARDDYIHLYRNSLYLGTQSIYFIYLYLKDRCVHDLCGMTAWTFATSDFSAFCNFAFTTTMAPRIWRFGTHWVPVDVLCGRETVLTLSVLQYTPSLSICDVRRTTVSGLNV